MEDGENRRGAVRCPASARRLGAGYGAVFDTVRHALRCGPRGNRARAGGAARCRCQDAKGGRMRGRKMKRLVHFVCAGAILLFARGSAAGQATTAKESGERGSVTTAEAQKFIEEEEERFFVLGGKGSRGGWGQGNFL